MLVSATCRLCVDARAAARAVTRILRTALHTLRPCCGPPAGYTLATYDPKFLTFNTPAARFIMDVALPGGCLDVSGCSLSCRLLLTSDGALQMLASLPEKHNKKHILAQVHPEDAVKCRKGLKETPMTI